MPNIKRFMGYCILMWPLMYFLLEITVNNRIGRATTKHSDLLVVAWIFCFIILLWAYSVRWLIR